MTPRVLMIAAFIMTGLNLAGIAVVLWVLR